MEINVQALILGLPTRFVRVNSRRSTDKPYHGFQYGVGRIIESRAPCDKRSSPIMKEFPFSSRSAALGAGFPILAPLSFLRQIPTVT
ncbi:MAG TPA: hypothetical protein VGF01_20790 [Terracidiphilus sp.]